MSFKSIVAAFSVSLFAVACGSASSRGDSETSAKVPVIPGIVGKWSVLDCKVTGTNQAEEPNEWSDFTYEFLNNGNLVMTATEYTAEGCKPGSEKKQEIATYAYKNLGADADGSLKIDYTRTKEEHKALSQEYAQSLASSNYYGFSDWKAGTVHDVTLLDLEGKPLSEEDSVQRTEYSRFKVKGNELFMPASEDGAYDGSSPEKRPKKVDETRKASRVK